MSGSHKWQNYAVAVTVVLKRMNIPRKIKRERRFLSGGQKWQNYAVAVTAAFAPYQIEKAEENGIFPFPNSVLVIQ